MRDAIIIISIIAIIVIGDICMQAYLNKTTIEIAQDLQNLKQNTILAKKDNERSNIKKEVNEIEKKWTEINKIWSTIVVHQELDNIEQAIIKAKSSIEEGELPDALQEIETTIFFVEHVKQREKLSLKNIF